MDQARKNENSWQTRILWCVVLGVAISVLAYSVFENLSSPFSRVLVLGVSSFVAILICPYETRIPGTKLSFVPKNIFAFWGVIWLGLAGGVLLSLVASFAASTAIRKNRREWLAAISNDVLSTFASAVAFYLTLGYYKPSHTTFAVAGLLISNEVIIGSFAMAAAHLFVSTSLAFLFDKFEGRVINLKSLDEYLGVPTGSYSISLGCTVLLFLVFNHFGIEFGLVIVPLAVFGNLAYKMHMRSLEQKTKMIMESSRIHLATVEALATAIDARDQVGIGHVRRTQIYSVGVGSVLGLGDDEISALRTGALLHDIGKLAVPDHILNKPGRLTPAEMEKTKIHASVGASILEKVGFPYPVVPTVKYHHEFWDGSGYPEGLKGTQIPLTARILTIADAYDTLRGARPYRPAVVRDEACSFLRAGAGVQFDPKLVDIFLRNLTIFENEIDAQGLSYEDMVAASGVREILLDANMSPNYVEQIKRANREVYTLYSLAKEFSGSLNLNETLALFTKKIAEFVPYDTSVVYLMDQNGDSATAAFVSGRNQKVLKGKRVHVGDGATGYVLSNRKAVENVDPVLDFGHAEYEFSSEYVAMASLPLIADDKLIGAISLYSSELPHYQDEHMRLLETVSRIAADAVQKSLKHHEAETYALTDPMTGLPNSRNLQLQFDKEVTRAERNSTSFQLLVLDLDGFKSVNDSFGHKVGDRMLKEVSSVISKQLREYDFLARYGGDEFVAIIPETDNAHVMGLCRRIEAAVNEFRLPVDNDRFAKVGVSLGSASYPLHGESFDQLVVAADKAMYLTKAINKQRMNQAVKDAESAADLMKQEDDTKADRELLTTSIDEDELNSFLSNGEVDNSDPSTDVQMTPEIEDLLIVELDESHIIASSAIN